MSTAVPTTAGTPSLSAWRNAIAGVFLVMGFAVATLLSRLPAMRDLLRVDSGEIGYLIASLSIGSIVGLLGSSALLHRFGPKRIILVAMPVGGLVVIALGLAAGVAHSYPLAMAAMVVYGGTVSLGDVSLNVSGAANERALGRTTMPYFHAGFAFGSVLGSAAGSAAEALGIPVPVHAAIVGAICFATPFIAARWIPGERAAEERERPDAAARRRVWLDPRTWAIGLVVFGFAYAEGGATDWLPLGVVDGRGFGNAQAAALLSTFMIAMTVGRLVGPRIVDRVGRFPVLAVSAGLALVALTLVIYVPVSWVTWVAVVAWGLGSALGFPLGMSAAGDDPALAATRVSAVSVIGYTAYLVGPTVVGLVAQHTGVLLALNIVLGFTLVAAVCTPSTRERSRR